MTDAPLDTLNRFETPEGVVLTMSVAGPVPRALAWLIDALFRYTIVIGLMMALGFLGYLGGGLSLLILFVVEWFYPVYFEVVHGATPGKKRLGLLVVHDDGTPLTWPSGMIRNLLRVVDFLPLMYGVGLITMLFSREFKRLGDLAAGTLVIHAPAGRQRLQVPEAAPLLPPLALTVDEQRAVLDFAERSNQLSSSRAEELAQHLVNDQKTHAAHQVIRYANGLMRL
ncbi:MAG: RDD family protein [Wenzhouxiangellaceae bacterium]